VKKCVPEVLDISSSRHHHSIMTKFLEPAKYQRVKVETLVAVMMMRRHHLSNVCLEKLLLTSSRLKC